MNGFKYGTWGILGLLWVTLSPTLVAEVGVYKGTFDPIHLGHLETLEIGRKNLNLKKVYIVPNFDTSHKPGASSLDQRWELTRLAVKDKPYIVLPPKELLLSIAGKTDPMQAFRKWVAARNPEEPLYTVIGTDSYLALKSPSVILDGNPPSRIAIVDRPESGELPDRLPEGVVRISQPRVSTSSTLIRSNVFHHASLLPPAVAEYILDQGMYDTVAHPQIPRSVRDLVFQEQARMAVDGIDTRRLIGLTNHQKPTFRPEARSVFPVKSYWVDESRMKGFEAHDMAPHLRNTFVRRKNGKKQYRLLVHPETEKFYEELLKGAERAKDFQATPTASPRSLVVWDSQNPQRALLVKVSLDAVVGGVNRTIGRMEIARSVGTHMLLAANRDRLPKRFVYFPEVLGLAPVDKERGGMIVRALPREFSRDGNRVVPLFSLYATPPNGSPPVLASMIRQSGLSPEGFVKRYLTDPFVELYLELAIHHGVVMEAHGQNVLVELGKDGLPTGRFFFRDLGGFNIDLGFWKARGYSIPENLPFVHSPEKDYHQNHAHEYASTGLHTYFSGAVLFHLDRRFPEWVRRGWIPPGKVGRRRLERRLVKDVEAYLRERTGVHARLGNSVEKLHLRIHAARRKLYGISQQDCQNALRAMFR